MFFTKNNQPILISAAMDVEFSLLKDALNNLQTHTIGGYLFYEGTLFSYPVVLSKTNIGIVNSACATTLGITAFSPCAILNIGTAGGHSRLTHQYDIVLGESCVNLTSFESAFIEEGYGVDITRWIHRTFLDFDGETDAATQTICDPTLLKLAQTIIYTKGKLFCGILGSGDVWNKEADRILWFNKHLSTMCEDMESLSVYQVAGRFHVPVLGIRIISNNEIHKEEYARDSASLCQHFTLEVVKKIIQL